MIINCGAKKKTLDGLNWEFALSVYLMCYFKKKTHYLYHCDSLVVLVEKIK